MTFVKATSENPLQSRQRARLLFPANAPLSTPPLGAKTSFNFITFPFYFAFIFSRCKCGADRVRKAVKDLEIVELKESQVGVTNDITTKLSKC